jgi:hypothetical protein
MCSRYECIDVWINNYFLKYIQTFCVVWLLLSLVLDIIQFAATFCTVLLIQKKKLTLH